VRSTMTMMPDSALDIARPRHHSAKLRFGVAFLIGVIITLGLGAGALYAYDQQYTGRVLPGVKVGSVDLSGRTPDEARSALAGAYKGMAEGRIVLKGPDGNVVITYGEIGRTLDADALVDQAMAVGRDGTAIDRAVANARTAFRGVVLEPRVTFDADLLATRITEVANALRVEPAEASVTLDAALAFQVVAGHSGRVVDATGIAQALASQVGQLEAPPEVTATFPVQTTEPDVTTAEATRAQADAERIAAGITLVVGSRKVPIDTKKLRPWVTFSTTADGGYAPVVDTTRISTLLDGLAKKIDRKTVNASFRTSGSKVTGITSSKDGYVLDVPATAKQIEGLLAARAIGTASTQVRPVLKVTAPALTTAEARAAAPKMRMISSWTTHFHIYERNNFGANIWIPALTIDGYVVGPREKFDFWKAVGTVSRAKGYGLGGAIINGKTEPQGALAGGICSCSTTLFNAVLRAGYQMGARRNHFYYIDRYPLGLDATVFQSGSGSVQTVSWTNDTDYPVLIRGFKIRSGSTGYVRFQIYSVPNGRKVSIGTPVVKNVQPASDSIQYTSSLAPGSTKRIEFPVDGKQVWRTVVVRDSNGTVIHKTTYYSNYARITGVVLVGR
ncbi:MAG: VanW family protein, partial [Chloroflexota bacterium]